MVIAIVSMIAAAPANATTATIGSPLTAAIDTGATCGEATFTNTGLPSSLAAPFDGAIVRWRLDVDQPSGSLSYRLRVIRPTAGAYTGAGTGPDQTTSSAGVNLLTLPSPLPVKAGDIIGVDCPTGAPSPVSTSAPLTSRFAFFSPTIADQGAPVSPNNQLSNEEELINADVVEYPSNLFSFGKAKRDVRRGSASLPVILPGPGTLRLAGKGTKPRSADAGQAGTVNLAVKPKGKAQSALKRTGKAKLAVTVTYTPAGEITGLPNAQTTKVKLRKRL